MVGKFTYTQTITWLKVLLPVSAVVLLSTLFLFAKSVDPTAELPFADVEIDRRISNQQITSPFLSGETSNGNEISFWAVSAAPDTLNQDVMTALDVKAQVASGTDEFVVFSASTALVNSRGLEATLKEDVEVHFPDGGEVLTEILEFDMKDGTAISETEVRGTTNFGQLTAGAMRISSDEATGALSILFTKGVKLVYTPVR